MTMSCQILRQTARCMVPLLLGSMPVLNHAQSGLSPELQAELLKLQNLKIESPSGGEAKGWTCRDPEDGKRMHVVDVTNIARMGKVPSSVAGLHDSKTPLASLPVCTRPS